MIIAIEAVYTYRHPGVDRRLSLKELWAILIYPISYLLQDGCIYTYIDAGIG